MNFVKPYFKNDIQQLTRKRKGEEKVGENVDLVDDNWELDLKKSNAQFVIVGIPEDIGVRANYGRSGAGTAFKPALDSFLSQQQNQYLNAQCVFVLGEIYVDDLMEKSVLLDTKQKEQMTLLRNLVSELDIRVCYVIEKIVSNQKIPIIIGGGHNNAYGNIKGTSLALHKKVSVINCDAHLDFREAEGRHSGNGFFCAYKEGYLNKYAVTGMHEQYNNQFSLSQFKKYPNQLYFNTYESIFVREEIDWSRGINQCIGFLKGETCGVEVDLDAITNVPSSAKTSSGISPIQARQFIHKSAMQLNCVYLHIAEGAPVLSHIKADNKTGKLIAYLISDFIKAQLSKMEL
jgi:formiminoglutamase